MKSPTQELLDNYNNEIADKLGVDLIPIHLQISQTAKSKFGHFTYSRKKDQFIINISSFIIGTTLEHDTLKHELCHAYDFVYLKQDPRTYDPQPHGKAWKAMMEQVFGFKNVKACGVHKYDSSNIRIQSVAEGYAVYENSKYLGKVFYDGEFCKIVDCVEKSLVAEDKLVHTFSKAIFN